MTSSMLAASTSAFPAPPASAIEPITVIAHRGASCAAPENTLPAVELAVRHRADLVEVDVQLTRDGQPVILHDTTLRRTTDVAARFPHRAPWNVADFTLAEIATLDAGSWFDSRYAGTPVPTLAQVLSTLHGRAGLLLEVKAPGLHPGIVAAIAGELRASGWVDAPGGRLVVQSFDWDCMRAFARLLPAVPVGLLGGAPSSRQLAELHTWADQLNTNHRRTTGRLIDRVHASGMVTWPFTVDNPDRMRSLIRMGVDGIITNRPDVLVEMLAPRFTPQAA